jgi:hypothetical protein
MNVELTQSRLPWRVIVITSLGLILALAAEFYALVNDVGYVEVIVGLTLIASAVVLIAGERGVALGFVIWVLSFAVGYRTIELTRYLKLHTSEIILWGLYSLLIAQRVWNRQKGRGKLPAWVWILTPFCLWGWWPGLDSGRALDKMFAEFRNFLLLIPLFAVAWAVLEDGLNWRRIVLAFYAAGTLIAGLGVLEYLFPGIKNVFPAFISQPVPVPTVEDFARARFSFWGGPLATLVCVLTAPMAVAIWHWWPTYRRRALVVLALLTQVYAIYIGGYRSLWFLLACEFLLFALMQKGLKRKVLVLGVLALSTALLVLWILPESALQRAWSLFMAAKGEPIDHSAETRGLRASDALTIALDTPWGAGWAGAGWVHSDFLQVAANLSLVAGALFLGAYAFTFARLWWRVQAGPELPGEQRALWLSLLLSFFAAGGILAVQAALVLPQLILPVWFVWALVEIWLRQNQSGGAIR